MLAAEKLDVVRYLRADPDYTRRPEPDETVAALARLAGNSAEVW
jgi:hypothetical protein